MKRFVAAYPGLTAEMAKLAAFYATTNPPRGRPREHSSTRSVMSSLSTRCASGRDDQSPGGDKNKAMKAAHSDRLRTTNR